MSSLTKITLTFVLLTLCVACRVKSPSIAEQQELLRLGAFPSGAPAWMASRAASRSFPSQSSGIVPESFGEPLVVTNSHADRDEMRGRLATATAALQNDKRDAKGARSAGALGRIEAACPGSESEVTAALTTEARVERIKKYELLTSRCPESQDIWLWLAKDYASEGRRGEATRCFNTVLSIDTGNAEATAGLRALNE